MLRKVVFCLIHNEQMYAKILIGDWRNIGILERLPPKSDSQIDILMTM